MSSTINKELSNIIRERHSVRQYDETYKISQEEIKSMIEEASLAPSSSNLQPWRFIVVQNEEVKKNLPLFGSNAKVAEGASAVIAVIGDTEMYNYADQIYQINLDKGMIDEATKKRLVDDINNLYPKAPLAVRENIVSFDAGLISMQLMLIAKAYGYDTLPMGGFDKVKFAEQFELTSRYKPILLIAIGKAKAEAFQSTRLPVDEIVNFV